MKTSNAIDITESYTGTLSNEDAQCMTSPLDPKDIVLSLNDDQAYTGAAVTIKRGFLGFRVRGGASANIKHLIVQEVKNDAVQLWNGGVSIDRLTVDHCLPVLYCKENHPDVFQAFAKMGKAPFHMEDVFDGLYIGSAVVEVTCENQDDKKNGFIFSEFCQYKNISLFSEGITYKSNSSAPYFLDMTNATQCVIGSEAHPIDPDKVSNKGIRIGAFGSKKGAPDCENIIIHAFEGQEIILSDNAKQNTDVIWYRKAEHKKYFDGFAGKPPNTARLSTVDKLNKSELIQWASEELDLEPELIQAVDLQESANGRAFWKGNPKILFEPVKFTKGLSDLGFDLSDVVQRYPEAKPLIMYQNPRKYGTYDKQWSRHLLACQINKEVAIECCSWGLFSVMGNNWRELGYDSAEHFRDDMDSEAGQFRAFVLYMRNKPEAIQALKARNWTRFKVLYNGPGKNDYAAELAQKYRRILAEQAPGKTLIKGKSRSVNAQVIDTVVKGAGGVGSMVYGSDMLSTINNGLDQFKAQADEIKETKIKVLEITDTVESLSGNLVTAQNDLAALSWMPWAIGLLFILLMIPNLRTLFAYLEDNGYLKKRGNY